MCCLTLLFEHLIWPIFSISVFCFVNFVLTSPIFLKLQSSSLFKHFPDLDSNVFSQYVSFFIWLQYLFILFYFFKSHLFLHFNFLSFDLNETIFLLEIFNLLFIIFLQKTLNVFFRCYSTSPWKTSIVSRCQGVNCASISFPDNFVFFDSIFIGYILD